MTFHFIHLVCINTAGSRNRFVVSFLRPQKLCPIIYNKALGSLKSHTHTHNYLHKSLQLLVVCVAGFLKTQGKTHDLWGTPSVWRYVFSFLQSLMKLCFLPLEDQNLSDFTKEETTYIFPPLPSFFFFSSLW